MDSLAKLGVPELATQYAARGLAVCHRPVAEGEVPGGRVLLHCTSGLGRSCTVAACLLLHVHEDLTADEAVEAVRRLRGPRAVQSVRQFNFIQEYREVRDEFLAEMAMPESRPVSR
ncbi:cyclin-dependent kinase inhibitor 3-like [Pollicipes pollicipes]|uniref:cyclin-dependent kinase inhibitor 3-like n=1 Tax=Pollicipes pollicipes TaxID=41117 RepID=UPI0018855023|nr:cyclin-dependent kinase inhibitor 3-like [Pollicipes pollicipes]